MLLAPVTTKFCPDACETPLSFINVLETWTLIDAVVSRQRRQALGPASVIAGDVAVDFHVRNKIVATVNRQRANARRGVLQFQRTLAGQFEVIAVDAQIVDDE